MLYNQKRSDAEEQRNAGGKKLHLRDWKKEFFHSFVASCRGHPGGETRPFLGAVCELKAEAVVSFAEIIAWRREHQLKF